MEARPPSTQEFRRAAFWRLMVVLGIQFGFLAGVLILSACYSPSAKLTSFDVMALPGEQVTIEAKIERDGPGFLNRDVGGVELELLSGPPPPAPGLPAPPPGQPPPPPDLLKVSFDPAAAPPKEVVVVGAATSDGNGFARWKSEAPREAGHYAFWVRVKQPSPLKPREETALLTLSVIPADRPIVITDIDNTICHTRQRALLGDRPDECEPLEGAPKVLGEIARSYAVVYLTARPSYLAYRTRRWLSHHGFPAGPVLFRDIAAEWRGFNFDEGEFKRQLIRTRVKAKWPEVRWGIGNTDNDLLGYTENGIRALLIGFDPLSIPNHRKDLVKVVKSWDEVRKAIAP